MKPVVPKPAVSERINVRRCDSGTKAAQISEAHVVEHD
jgi:hypothetical protein